MNFSLNRPRYCSAAINRKTLLWLTPLVVIALLVVSWWVVRLKHERARATWKNTALSRLSGLSINDDDIRKELETLKAATNNRPEWVSDNLIVMTNGEYLIYASRHGFNSGFVDHLFLAHGSDNRWYYSTYHFCNRMVGIQSEDPPGSIAEFARQYAAREFDGKSDECLEHTWPPDQ